MSFSNKVLPLLGLVQTGMKHNNDRHHTMRTQLQYQHSLSSALIASKLHAIITTFSLAGTHEVGVSA